MMKTDSLFYVYMLYDSVEPLLSESKREVNDEQNICSWKVPLTYVLYWIVQL
jgi:hypothetical protein